MCSCVSKDDAGLADCVHGSVKMTQNCFRCSWVGKSNPETVTDCVHGLCLWVGKHAETVSDCVFVLVNMALGWFQILFMVGKGYLRPDITRCRSDTPKQFKRILQDCVHFAREDRPLFPQVGLEIMNCCFLSLLLAFLFNEVDWFLFVCHPCDCTIRVVEKLLKL